MEISKNNSTCKELDFESTEGANHSTIEQKEKKGLSRDSKFPELAQSHLNCRYRGGFKASLLDLIPQVNQ